MVESSFIANPTTMLSQRQISENGPSEPYTNRLSLRVVRQCRLSKLTANATLLVTTKWNLS